MLLLFLHSYAGLVTGQLCTSTKFSEVRSEILKIFNTDDEVEDDLQGSQDDENQTSG